ncbi:hypothetical protein CTAM01_10141 [Colletotrichum tamarilloi]|uniref:Uncharacterized protein n=1 Tax=Colletotrichum tamarilloi TaxID=1209934 RepID=A0ABQ9R1N0_9PEZI|nr:uncharacterized protein CTAM01_10141 [Colletotrichum tamarilloi]KAK1492084.1 hypothetical protein CTAM01_10141 [Colletotrichum tamarilloi]
MAQALGNMPSLAGKLLRAPVTGRTPCSANVACATPPEGPSLDDQSVINGKIMLGALSVSGAVGKLNFWPDVALRGQFASCYPSAPRRDQSIYNN